MNKLEEYKLSSNPYKEVEKPLEDIQKLRREGYNKGFDAAIALDLPVKFAEWLMQEMIFTKEIWIL